MKRFSSLILLSTLFLSTSCGQDVDVPTPPAPSSGKVASIHVGKELQVMDGFGASDAWRCQMVGKYWPVEKKNAIAELLFSKETQSNGAPKGIGLSIWRFYLGAGSMEQGANSMIRDEWRRGECFQNPDGTYNWNKQEGQRWFLQAAKKHGVEKFLAFTISPPVQMTQNGKAFASKKQEQMNIQEGKLPAYADFLVTTVQQLEKQEGITFDYLSPINEPQWDWMAGTDGYTSQEGTPASNADLHQFTTLLSDQLQKKSMKTQLVLSEAAAINYLYQNVNAEDRDDQINALFGSSSVNKIGHLPNVLQTISGHSYFSVWPLKDQVEHRQKLATRLQQVNTNLKYWQSEYCILENPGEAEIPGGGGGKRDLGMQTALFVARIIHNDITVAGASSWQWWTALTRHDYKDGLIYLDDGASNGVSGNDGNYCKQNGEYRASKLLWAFGNYSLFVRPGMTRVNVSAQDPLSASSDVMISAYIDKSQKKLVIVAVNVSNKPSDYQFKIDGMNIVQNQLTPYITSESSNLAPGAKVDAGKLTIPAKSVVTYVGVSE